MVNLQEQALIAKMIVESEIGQSFRDENSGRLQVGELCQYLGIDRTIHRKHLLVDGYLHRESGHTSIYVDQLADTTRSNFTVAHELGHIILARFRGECIRPFLHQSGSIPSEEYLVNAIAAELLVPYEHALSLVGNSNKPSWSVIESICNQYRISASAAVLRILSLSEIIGVWLSGEVDNKSSTRVTISIGKEVRLKQSKQALWENFIFNDGSNQNKRIDLSIRKNDNGAFCNTISIRVTRKDVRIGNDKRKVSWVVGWKRIRRMHDKKVLFNTFSIH